MAVNIEDVFGFLVLFWRSWLQRDNMTYRKCSSEKSACLLITRRVKKCSKIHFQEKTCRSKGKYFYEYIVTIMWTFLSFRWHIIVVSIVPEGVLN
jgi:hypothetical protein